MQQHRKQGSADTTQKASNMRCTHAHCREPQAVTTPSPPRSPTLAHIHRYVDVGWLNIMSLLSVEPKKRDSSIIFLPAKHTHLHTYTHAHEQRSQNCCAVVASVTLTNGVITKESGAIITASSPALVRQRHILVF